MGARPLGKKEMPVGLLIGRARAEDRCIRNRSTELRMHLPPPGNPMRVANTEPTTVQDPRERGVHTPEQRTHWVRARGRAERIGDATIPRDMTRGTKYPTQVSHGYRMVEL